MCLCFTYRLLERLKDETCEASALGKLNMCLYSILHNESHLYGFVHLYNNVFLEYILKDPSASFCCLLLEASKVLNKPVIKIFDDDVTQATIKVNLFDHFLNTRYRWLFYSSRF